MLRRSLKSLTDSLSKALLRTVPIGDLWQRYEHDVPTHLYGLGASHDFSWYLEGESTVQISSLEEMLSWLDGCTYTTDPELFREPDFWQHPCTFERIQTGDCEDFALWGWRKLIELGYETEFVAGRCRKETTDSAANEWATGHAWIHFDDNGRAMLLDAVCSRGGLVLCPKDEVKSAYLPEVSVDANLKRYVYGGYYLLQQVDRSS